MISTYVKKILIVSIALLCIALVGCSGEDAGDVSEASENIGASAGSSTSAEVTDISGLGSSRVGVMTGTIGEMLIREDYPGADVRVYDNIMDGVQALKAGQLEYIITAYPTATNLVKVNQDLKILPEELMEEDTAIAVRKETPELTQQINELLAGYKESGLLDEIIVRWLREDGSDYGEMPEIPGGTGEKLVVGVAANREPMCFVADGEYSGLDMELIRWIASDLDRTLEFKDMSFSALIPALKSGKVDVIISNITPTQERKKSVDFSTSYYVGKQIALIRNPEKIESPGVLESLKNSFEANFITENRYKLLLQGLGTTVMIALGSAFIGTLLGFGICMLRMSKNKIASGFAGGYIVVIRGIPVLVLLMLVYYVILAKLEISPIIISILTFSINFSAYVSEIMRTAIESVDKGQREAAAAMGFTKVQVFTSIIFPQAARIALPVYKGEFVSMIKMTSVVGYVAIMDLTKASDLIRARSFEAAFPLMVIAVIYLVISYILVWFLSRIELTIDPKRRKREVKF